MPNCSTESGPCPVCNPQAWPIPRCWGELGSMASPSRDSNLIRDRKYRDVKEKPPRMVYFTFAQADSASSERTLHVKTAGHPKNLVAAIRHGVQTLDKNLPVYDVGTFTELVEKTISQERLIAALSSLFGLLALVLASVGLYGVMAYAVVRRTREIGIRMALGAARANVLWLVLRETLTLVLIGIGVGLPAAFAATRVVTNRLFGLTPTDPSTIVMATIILAIVAAFAGYVPARRATKVDPMEALRYA